MFVSRASLAATLLALLFPPTLVFAQQPGASLGSLAAHRPQRAAAKSIPQQQPVVSAIALQIDGSLLAAAGDDHLIRLRRTDTLEEVATLAGHTDWVRSLEFSPDGRQLISAGNDGQIVFWDLATHREAARLAVGPMAVSAARISPQGRYLAVCGFQNQLRIYSLSGEKTLIRRLACPCSDMRAIAFSNDGQQLAAAGRNGKIRVWNTESFDVSAEKRVHQRRIRDLIFVDQRVVSVSEDRHLAIWDLSDESKSFRLEAPTKLFSLAMYDKGRVVTGGADNRIRYWDLDARLEIGNTREHTGSVVALAARKQLILSGSFDTSVRLVNAADTEAALRRQAPANN